MLIRLILLILCAWPTFASAQQELRSSTKGASTPLPITGSVVDADHNALDVKCLSGCSGGGGAGDASLAEQQTQTGILTTIDTDTGNIATNTSTLAGAIDGTKIKAMLVNSSGAEVVMPTAGLTHYDAADASTNSTAVLAAAGTVYHYSLSNTTTTVYYLRMYNSASAPTCSSATGFVESIPIPPASAAGQVGGRERIMNIGQAFTTGISYCITASSGSTANDAAAAGVFVTILYKAN